MAAVWIRLRAELRSRWRAWLALAVLVGLAAGLVIAAAAGARRTDSVVTRWRAATEAMDVWVARSDVWGLEADFSRIEQLPQVDRATRSINLPFWSRTEAGRPITVNETELNVAVNGRDGNAYRPKLLAGRSPNPVRADEIVVDSRAADHFDLQVGSTLRTRFATPSELTKIAETGEFDPRADPDTAGTGLLLSLRVVGVRATLASEDTLRGIAISPAFYETYGRRVGKWFEFTGVRLERGDADLADFRAGVERLAGGGPVELWTKRNLVAKFQSSINLQAQALWMLAALGALAALLLVGQALGRQAFLDSTDHPLLRSLGMTGGQLFALGLLRVIPVAAVAGMVAAGVAVAVSPLAPIGVARSAEPDPGFALDAPVLVSGAIATVALAVVAALAPAWRAARAGPVPGRARSSAVVRLLARRGLSPRSVSGVRLALEPGMGRTAVPVRSTILAAVVGTAAVAAALTITASADHLLGTPSLYGHNWDAVIGNGSDPEYPEELVNDLRSDRSIAQLSAGTVSEVKVGGKPTGVLAMDQLRGSLSPIVVEGRAPREANEILLGTKTAGGLAAEIGDEVEARVADSSLAFRVVGRGVLPEIGVAGLAGVALGEGVWITFEALERLAPNVARNVIFLGLAAGADQEATLARLERDASAAVPSRPSEVGNWGRVGEFPYVLAGVIAAAAAAVLAHALVVSIRRRRRDLAILKTLGFVRRDVRATVAWQATTVAAIGLLVGLPLGIGIGRFAWNVFAADLGVVSEPVVPVWPALLVVPAALLLVNLVALLPGRIAAGTRPALVLRAE